MIEIRIVRKEGFIINPDDKEVNKIFRQLDRNGGHCPSKVPNREGHDQCPCSAYLQFDKCYCKLYVRENEKDSK